MECIGGPLDGHLADPSDVIKGRAVLGLVREKMGYRFDPNKSEYAWTALKSGHATATAEYAAVDGGKLKYVSMRS
jgi:hypothetical protein